MITESIQIIKKYDKTFLLFIFIYIYIHTYIIQLISVILSIYPLSFALSLSFSLSLFLSLSLSLSLSFSLYIYIYTHTHKFNVCMYACKHIVIYLFKDIQHIFYQCIRHGYVKILQWLTGPIGHHISGALYTTGQHCSLSYQLNKHTHQWGSLYHWATLQPELSTKQTYTSVGLFIPLGNTAA